MFQEVAANPASLERYIKDMVAACLRKGVTFRLSTDVIDDPELLAPFDRIVVATGASYPYGLGPWAMALLDLGAGGWPGISQIMSEPKVRDWFYYRARSGTADRFRGLAQPGPDRHRDRRRGEARQEQGGDRQRLRGGAVGQ